MPKRRPGWIGVDLDRTLAKYEGFKGPTHIGEPVPAMLERVKAWLAEGREVRIFTARVSQDGTSARILEVYQACEAISAWLITHLGVDLPVTCVKDYDMEQLWDDRVVQVVPNTGERVGNLDPLP